MIADMMAYRLEFADVLRSMGTRKTLHIQKDEECDQESEYMGFCLFDGGSPISENFLPITDTLNESKPSINITTKQQVNEYFKIHLIDQLNAKKSIEPTYFKQLLIEISNVIELSFFKLIIKLKFFLLN